jgi:hypothetical protein
MSVEPRTDEWCRICRSVTHFERLVGYATAPDFRICQLCGDGYSVPKESAS